MSLSERFSEGWIMEGNFTAILSGAGLVYLQVSGCFFDGQKMQGERVTDCVTWRREVRELVAPLRTVSMQLQVKQHFWSATLSLMVSVDYWIVGEMGKEGLILGKVNGVIFRTVVLRVANRLCKISRNQQDSGAVCMAVYCHRANILLPIIWSYRNYIPWNMMVKQQKVGWKTDIRNHLHLLMKRRKS